MVNENLKLIENKKPVETVYELKDEYKIPSFEEFIKNYKVDEKINDNYQGEFDSYGDIRLVKSYGPGNTSSVEGQERAKKITKWTVGGMLAVTTVVCPPAGIASTSAVGALSGGAKIVGKFGDEDSDLRGVCDTISEVYADGVKNGAKIYAVYKCLENQK